MNITFKKDVDYFKNSKIFEFAIIPDSDGHRRKKAFYFHGLHQFELNDPGNLPDGYSVDSWKHSKYLYRGHGFDIGVVVCSACGFRRKHNLKWPEDAFFQVVYKNKILWSFDRAHTIELLEFVKSKDRDREKYRYRNFLFKIPVHFLAQNAREPVVKLLSKKLGVARPS
ncbi:MAG: hypothetical protein AAFW83_05030 [Pseudomonadota bacterium]